MKKIISLLLFIFIFSLACCDGADSPTDNPGNNNNPGTEQPGEPTLLEFEGITFNDKTVIYDGNEHTIEVSNAPSFASVTYTNQGPHVNVGTYEITALVKAEGYKDLTLKATLIIGSSEGGLTFEEYNRYIVNKTYDELPYTVEMEIKQEGETIVVTRPNDLKKMKSLHGLTRTLINNMVVGVSQGYQKVLEINGVGYRAAKAGNKLTLSLGYSHPVEMVDPEGVETVLEGQNKITVKGIDKEKVGQYAAEIRDKRRPEPYKGKGIKYADEVIRRKVGKTGKK